MTILSLGRRPHRRRHGRGQTLVEFALVIPIFLLILMTLIDFGRVVYAQHTINQDAAEGARVGAVSATTLVTTLEFNNRYQAIRDAAHLVAPAVAMNTLNTAAASIKGDPARACGAVVGGVPGASPVMPNDGATGACFYPYGVKNTVAGTPPKVTVNISVDVPLITPIISSIVGGVIRVSASSSQLLQ